jgi:hypothetical protein
MEQKSSLTTNAIAFIGICNEYCVALENCSQTERNDFVATMLKLLPRLYIMATDLQASALTDDAYLESALDEDYYEAVRRDVEQLMGEDDIYLEVFEEDMKYSDTPVSASIAEGLTDIFQVLFNFIATVRDATEANVDLALVAIKDDFRSYWSQTLCNTLRALNNLAANQ